VLWRTSVSTRSIEEARPSMTSDSGLPTVISRRAAPFMSIESKEPMSRVSERLGPRLRLSSAPSLQALSSEALATISNSPAALSAFIYDTLWNE
jgi:hypothetical protein